VLILLESELLVQELIESQYFTKDHPNPIEEHNANPNPSYPAKPRAGHTTGSDDERFHEGANTSGDKAITDCFPLLDTVK